MNMAARLSPSQAQRIPTGPKSSPSVAPAWGFAEPSPRSIPARPDKFSGIRDQDVISPDLLPAYLSYVMGLNDESTSRATHVRNALAVGAVVSAGFLLVFGVAGVLITAGFRVVIDLLPWLAIAVGVGVIGLGIAMLFGYQLTIGLPKSKQTSTG